MKLSKLLHQREALLRQTHLANLAFAFHRLGEFSDRIVRAGLRGKVCLSPSDPDTERYWPVLTALEGNQSVIEEHFTDEDILELDELLCYVTDDDDSTEMIFRLESIEARFIRPLRLQLRHAGVKLDPERRLLHKTTRSRGGVS